MTKSVITGLLTLVFLSGCTAGKSTEQVAAVTGTPAKPAETVVEKKSGTWTPELNQEERDTLFAIAEDTLKWCVTGAKQPFSFDKYKITDRLKKPTHTFVTLKTKPGALRGCIGSLPPMTEQPMYISVYEHTIYSALNDSRFQPVDSSELGNLEIDISLLGPVTEIKSISEFNIGEHGIIVSYGEAHGVYLPEVAVEQHWSKEQTLNHVCAEKACLPADIWRRGATMEVFSSVVLSREKQEEKTK